MNTDIRNEMDPTKPHNPLRWQALQESAALVALGAAVVLVLLLLAGAPLGLQAVVWAAFVGDLVVMRLASMRMRHAVERVPPSLPSWQREEPVGLFEA